MRHLVISLQDVLCVVNVQHNCVDHNFSLTLTRTVWQERERTQACLLEVSHKMTDDFIINTGQMRHSKHLK
ncbi:hypothetical protein OF83DRAFT_1072164, partial [Amylostereum chailletii]